MQNYYHIVKLNMIHFCPHIILLSGNYMLEDQYLGLCTGYLAMDCTVIYTVTYPFSFSFIIVVVLITYGYPQTTNLRTNAKVDIMQYLTLVV